MQKLPIGIQTFKDIKDENYLYIDKTKEAYELIEGAGRYFFLSRPRRFGKSLFIDTLHNIFEGNKELFKGLYIYDKYDFKPYPVIKISWAGADYQTLEDFEAKTDAIFRQNQVRLGVECKQTRPNRCFEELIQNIYKKYNQKVVVLVDEYDKPILNVIENPIKAKENREIIKGIYEVLKDNDAYIRFAFLTGVSKFSKASIFSGLNMLTDISLNPKYGNICGYTQNDIETTFKPYLQGVNLEKVKEWYNGYNFLKDSLYNPFDILQFITNDYLFRAYWFETGSPTFLLKLIKEKNYFLPKLSNLIVDEKLVSSFDIDKIDIEVLLYQAGYLTIEEMIIDEDDDIYYKLKLPNKEVKKSLFDYIIRYLTNQSSTREIKSPLFKSLKQADLQTLKQTIISLFASIPYNNYTKNDIANYEGYYASVLYAYFASLGIQIIGEDATNKGRIDLTLFVEEKIYILEFKVIESGDNALEQIKQKNYHQKYLSQNKDIYLIGIKFDKKERNIESFDWEKIDQERSGKKEKK